MEHMLGIVVADFNTAITEPMLAAARDEAASLDAKIAIVQHVPGAYELPLIADELLSHRDITAVIVLGFIERGETQHGEVMAHTITGCLLTSSLKHQKPLGLGIIGPGALITQAEARKDSYARAAVRAAIASTTEYRKAKTL
jgi:6,7-dimethyl-8-ribityllumazine synthase